MASATFYITSNSYKSPSSSEVSQPRTYIDETGKLHVMGIVLGESTVRDAERAFRSRADAAIFMYPLAKKNNERRFHLELEAYFPAIADHSKVMLKLMVEETQLEQIRQRSTPPRMYPNGVARRNLGSYDVIAVQNIIIRQLILMPSVQVNKDILNAQFGEAESIQQESNGLTSYVYPKLGLVAVINAQGKDKFTFSNP